jgi:hypothetical protein
MFLSGNWPLVEVISAALARSATRTAREGRNEAGRQVTTLIGHAFRFRNYYVDHPDQAPAPHVILFDEAQRAWSGKQVARKTRKPFSLSEPQLLLESLSRRTDWAVIVAMVGGGQEINTGESGLSEWGRALNESHGDWLVCASPNVLPGAPVPPGGLLWDSPSSHPAVESDPRLHLEMNVRSPRAEQLNQWVDHLLAFNVEAARACRPNPEEFPVVMTRDLDEAKAWLRERAEYDANERIGLIASAEARRLRAWGIDTRTLQREQAWAHWFLAEGDDVRGSNQLEVAATGFDCQGLEIDWAGVCWGNDFFPNREGTGWKIQAFQGSKWTTPNAEKQRFILNGYRVILTRARNGQVFWVPKPTGRDRTLPTQDFDAIAELLQAAGVQLLD